MVETFDDHLAALLRKEATQPMHEADPPIDSALDPVFGHVASLWLLGASY